MICNEWQEQFDAYVDDASAGRGPDDFAALEEHLRSCPSCAAEILARMQLKHATRAAAARYVPSPDFRRRVEKSIQADRKPTWGWKWIPNLAGIAAAFLSGLHDKTPWGLGWGNPRSDRFFDHNG